MSGAGKSLAYKGLAVGTGVIAGLLLVPAVAGAAEAPKPALVHATPNNECRLNVRSGPDVKAPILHTLTCDNYTTCVNAVEGESPCGPYVVGGEYSCVGQEDTQVTDNRWAKVAWGKPEASYVAVACAAFRD